MREITVQDLDIIKQSCRNIQVRLELCDYNFKVIDVLEGFLVSDSYSINSDSDIRRTYNFTMHINDNKYLMTDTTNIFMNKIVVPYIGIKYERTQEILWYKYGVYCVLRKGYSYDVSNHTLDVSCEDMTCLINGELSGELKDNKVKILAEENIRDCIIALLNDIGIKKYMICDFNGKTIPYDMEFSSNTYYDIIKEIIDLYSVYEMFFDIDGTFVIQEKPIKISDNIVMDNNIIQPLLISDNGNCSYKEIYNHIIVYGMEIEAERNSISCSYDASINTYNATFDILSSYENFQTYAIDIDCNNQFNAKININNIGAKNIVIDDNTPISESRLEGGNKYVFRYRRLTDDFLLLGKYQVFGEAYDENPNSPYSVKNLGYEKVKVLQDGEYAKIYSDKLAKDRAEIEIYNATNRNDSINITMMSIPWLDVNYKVSYTSKNVGETFIYVIKTISGSTVEATMNVEMIRYYPNYEEIL